MRTHPTRNTKQKQGAASGRRGDEASNKLHDEAMKTKKQYVINLVTISNEETPSRTSPLNKRARATRSKKPTLPKQTQTYGCYSSG